MLVNAIVESRRQRRILSILIDIRALLELSVGLSDDAPDALLAGHAPNLARYGIVYRTYLALNRRLHFADTLLDQAIDRPIDQSDHYPRSEALPDYWQPVMRF